MNSHEVWNYERRLVMAKYHRARESYTSKTGKELSFRHWSLFESEYARLRKAEKIVSEESIRKVRERIRRLFPLAFAGAVKLDS